MAQTTLINGLTYSKATVNQDLRTVRVAVREALHDFEAVPLSQLTTSMASISSNLEALITQEVNNRTTEDANLTDLINSNYNSLRNLYMGIRAGITVATRVTTLAALANDLPNVDLLAPISSHQRLILVDAGANSPVSGIYYQTGGTAGNYSYTRHADWDAITDFQAGLEVFVNDENLIYKLLDDASSDGEGGFTVTFSPWLRPEALNIASNTDSQFLSKVGSELRADVDNIYFRVLNGELTWSAALVSWKSAVDTAITNIATLQSTVNTHTSQISSLQSTVATNSTAITNLNTLATQAQQQLTVLQATDTQHSTGISSLQSSVTAINTKNGEQDTRLTALEAADATQDSLINSLRTDVDAATAVNTQQNTRLNTLETNDTAQNSRITALETSDTQQTTLITGLRTDVDAAIATNTQQNTRLNALETTDQTHSSLISGLRTDVDGAIAVNTQQNTRLDALEAADTAIQTQVNALPTEARIFQILMASSIRRTLTNGTTTFIDGVYETVFNVDVTAEVALLGNGAAFRVVAVNDAAIPFTQNTDLIASYPNNNTVSVKFHSTVGAVPNGEVEVSLHAFFS